VTKTKLIFARLLKAQLFATAVVCIKFAIGFPCFVVHISAALSLMLALAASCVCAVANAGQN
jgi:hypothetical protein